MKYLEDFLNYLRGNNISNSTITNYDIYLRLCFDYLHINSDEQILQVTKADINNYLQYVITEKKLHASTRNSYVIAIRSFYTYLLDERNLDIDMGILRIKHIKTPIVKDTYLNKEEATDMLHLNLPLRTRLIIHLFLRTGVRVSELTNIKLSDLEEKFDEKKNCWYYHILIHGKGSKERYVSTDDETYDLINKYIKTTRKKFLENTNQTCEYLLVSRTGKKMTPRNIQKMIKDICVNKMNLPQGTEMTPHKLRHTYTTLMLQAENTYIDKEGKEQSGGKKYDIKTISESLGHTNLNTTNRYSHTSEKDISDMQREGW